MPLLHRPLPIPPAPLEPSPALDLAALPSPPPGPPAAAEDQVRRSLPMKLKMLVPYAVSFLFGGVGRACGMALVGFHVLMCVITIISFTTDPELARLWLSSFRAKLYIGLAAIVLIEFVIGCYYVYGLYTEEFDPSLEEAEAEAEAEVLLPPPPPEMDMC